MKSGETKPLIAKRKIRTKRTSDSETIILKSDIEEVLLRTSRISRVPGMGDKVTLTELDGGNYGVYKFAGIRDGQWVLRKSKRVK